MKGYCTLKLGKPKESAHNWRVLLFPFAKGRLSMQNGFVALETALRVLTALTYKREPNPLDAEKLRALAHIKHQEIGLDELACSVVHAAVRNRAEIR